MITKLEPNQIFVFGSNLAGRHGAGAAKQAREKFGAVYGIGEGLTGQCYACPTLDQWFQKLPIESLMASRDKLYKCCLDHPHLEFLLTKVGCGLAGYHEYEIIDIFISGLILPSNLKLPEDWCIVGYYERVKREATGLRGVEGTHTI